MLQQTNKFEGVVAICSDALEYSQLKNDIVYDRILMKEVVGRFENYFFSLAK